MSWRTFKFFENEDVKDPEDTNAFNSLLKRPVSSSSNPMIFLIEAHCSLELWSDMLHVRQRTNGPRRYPSLTSTEAILTLGVHILMPYCP